MSFKTFSLSVVALCSLGLALLTGSARGAEEFVATPGGEPNWTIIDLNEDGTPDGVSRSSDDLSSLYGMGLPVEDPLAAEEAQTSSSAVTATDWFDTDGDGSLDEITRTISEIRIYHPRTGGTSSYPYRGSFSFAGYTDTDGVAGLEIVVVWTEQSGVMGIDVIHDRTRSKNSYSYYQTGSIGVNSVWVDTDGVAGSEIIVVWHTSWSSGIDVIHDRTRSKNSYAQNRSFAISRWADTDGVVGSEIVVVWTEPWGLRGIQVIRDLTRATKSYAYYQTSSIAVDTVVDTDGVAGNEIVVVWHASWSTSGIDIIHDSSGNTNRYAINVGFGIQGVRDYDGMPGVEICYVWFASTSSGYTRIIDRTRTRMAVPSC